MISDARIAQRLCVHQADKFTERPPGLFLARVLKNKGILYTLVKMVIFIYFTYFAFQGIVFNDGPSWKEHRSFLTHEFRKYGFGKQSMEQRIQYVIDEYLHQIGVSLHGSMLKEKVYHVFI